MRLQTKFVALITLGLGMGLYYDQAPFKVNGKIKSAHVKYTKQVRDGTYAACTARLQL